jgi:hypothetical protein
VLRGVHSSAAMSGFSSRLRLPQYRLKLGHHVSPRCAGEPYEHFFRAAGRVVCVAAVLTGLGVAQYRATAPSRAALEAVEVAKGAKGTQGAAVQHARPLQCTETGINDLC